ncbi:MAG: ATP-binding protein, partial [Candidatus Woesearchaeota archaeon]|nr:ATP-binding protein [Candidatus Woesearchaeota archaeon]
MTAPLRETFQKVFLNKDSFADILGQEKTKQQLKSALIMGRHVIIAGPPGVGKTTLAKNVASLLPELVLNDCEFHCTPTHPACPSCLTKKPKTRSVKGVERFVRVQGSPDLTAEDLLGDIDPVKALQFGPSSPQAFTPGKIFKANQGILFFDEVNRAPEKIQNSLLQVLEEGHATIGTHTVELEANFLFIGTMNPDETASTERLSDVFLDRFDVVLMDHPESLELETRIVHEKGETLPVEFPSPLLANALDFIRGLRIHKDIKRKPSVRASLGVFERAQANAFLNRRKIVIPDDIADAFMSVLAH